MKQLAFVFFISLSFQLVAQSIAGNLTYATNDTISLYGFNGFNNYLIAKTTVNKDGNFALTFSKEDYGMGYLAASDNKPFFLVLCDEDVKIKGEMLSVAESIVVERGKENQLFEKYATEHPRREQALSAWDFLEKIYQNDTLFSSQKSPANAILKEKQRISKEDNDFIKSLSKESYISWYLPMRTLISSVSTIAQYNPEKIPATIEMLRKIDYSDMRLYKSGLFKDALDNHFWFLENSGRSLDSVFVEMEKSIDVILKTVVKDETKFNEVTNYLFDLLEQHSLYKASEYLALKVLNSDECGCSVQSNVSDKLEQYRAMKIGKTATDFSFPADLLAKEYANNLPQKLSDIKTEYKLVVFGSSWCTTCAKELPQIVPLYNKWRQSGLEVVFVSLDVEKEMFHRFASYFPFVSVCDYQKWDSPIVKSYYVSGTPTMYLLDKNHKILLRPISIKQMDAWMDWYIIGKK